MAAAAAAAGAGAPDHGKLWALEAAKQFAQTPIRGILLLFRDLAVVSPKDAIVLNAASEAIQHAYGVKVLTVDVANGCFALLDKLFAPQLARARVKPLEPKAAVVLDTITAVSDLSIMSPPVEALTFLDAHDPVDGKAAAQMYVHRSTYTLGRIMADMMRLLYTHRRGAFEERPVDWLDHDLELRAGKTKLTRVCITAAREPSTRAALSSILESAEMKEALEGKSSPGAAAAAAAATAHTDAAATLSVDRHVSAIIKRAQRGMRSAKLAAANPTPIIGKATLFRTSSMTQTAAYSFKAITEQLEMLDICLKLAANDDDDDATAVSARFTAMREDITKRMAANRVVTWQSSGAGDLWAPPSATNHDTKAVVKFVPMGADVKQADWYVLAEVAEAPGMPWNDFIEMAHLGLFINRGSAAVNAASNQFAEDVERYVWHASAHDAHVRTSTLVHKDFPALMAGDRKAIDNAVRAQLEKEMRSVAVRRHNAVDAAPVFSPAHVQYVYAQLKHYASITPASTTVLKLMAQIDTLTSAAGLGALSFASTANELRKGGYEALCTLLFAFRGTNEVTPLGAQLRAQERGPPRADIKLDVGKQTALLRNVDERLHRCVFYNAVVDRCIVYLYYLLDALPIDKEQHAILAVAFIRVWVLRLSLAVDTQTFRNKPPTRRDKEMTVVANSLLAVPAQLVCQTTVEADNLPVDDNWALLVHMSRLDFGARVGHARTTVSETAYVQAVLWERAHAIHLLRAKYALAEHLRLETSATHKSEPVNTGVYVQAECENARALATMAVMSLCTTRQTPPELKDLVYGKETTAKAACTAVLEAIKTSTALSGDVPVVDVRAELIQVIKHYNPRLRGQLFGDVSGMMLRGFLDAVNGLAIPPPPKSDSSSYIISVPRLIECLSLFNGYVLDDALIDKWVDMVPKHIYTGNIPTLKHVTERRAARDALLVGNITKFTRAVGVTLDRAEMRVLHQLADPYNQFLDTSPRPTSLDELELAVWDTRVIVGTAARPFVSPFHSK